MLLATVSQAVVIMMRRIIAAVIFVVLIYGTMVDSYSIIKSCCDAAVNGARSYFSTSTRQSGIYNIIDLCAQGSIIQGCCDAVTDGGRWLVIQQR